MWHEFIIQTKENDLVVRQKLLAPLLLNTVCGAEVVINGAMKRNEKAIKEREQDGCDHEYHEVIRWRNYSARKKRCKKCMKVVEIGENDCDFIPLEGKNVAGV